MPETGSTNRGQFLLGVWTNARSLIRGCGSTSGYPELSHHITTNRGRERGPNVLGGRDKLSFNSQWGF